tara:strand:- start:155 stop:1318 length:1164 start_codon:yes stop_codon:yes gene_type:complete
MANGYKQGDFLGQFLAQLPQLYRNKQNLDFQRERFEYMKEEGVKDDIYRNQVLTDNQERNQLARQRFEQSKQQNSEDEAYRKATLENSEQNQVLTAFSQALGASGGNPELQDLLLKQHPSIKNNPNMVNAVTENRALKEAMQQKVFSIEGLSPIQAIKTGRTLYSDTNLDTRFKASLDATLREKENDLKFTLSELKDTPEGIEFAKYYEQFENLDKYLPAGTTPKQREQYSTVLLNNMQGVYDEAAAKERALGGDYNEPIFGDIEEVSDEEIEKLLGDDIAESDSTGTGVETGMGTGDSELGVETETAGKSFRVGTMSADAKKLKESNIYNQLQGKTSAQKKQMVEKIIGRSLSESEVGNLILKSRLPDLGLQFEVGSAPKDIQIRK